MVRILPAPLVRLSVTPDGAPPETAAETVSVPRRKTRGGKGRTYPDSTMQRVRHLLETTPLSQKEIGRRTGVPQATISLWQRSLGWHRPLGAPLNPTIAALWRTGPALKLTMLTRQLVAIAERMTRELEQDSGTDIDKLMQALQVVRMARVTLQGNRRRKLLVGRARTGFEVMKEDDAIRAALKEMQRGGVDWDRAPDEATQLVIEANTPAVDHAKLLRVNGRRGRQR